MENKEIFYTAREGRRRVFEWFMIVLSFFVFSHGIMTFLSGKGVQGWIGLAILVVSFSNLLASGNYLDSNRNIAKKRTMKRTIS